MIMVKSNSLEVRKALGLTQAQFAQLLGVHSMTVSKWERRVTMPSAYQTALMNEFSLAIYFHNCNGRVCSFADFLVLHGPLRLLHHLLNLTFENRKA